MSKQLNIGLIGLDTSHVTAFSDLLNNKEHPYHVPGARVAAAFPGGSPDLFASHSRVEGFTNELRDKFGVTIYDSVEAVAEAVDAIMIESVDGRVHLDYLRRVAKYGKPVFIDKPMTISSKDALEMQTIAKEYNIPVMSSSSLRYSEALTAAVANTEKGAILGADVYSPMALEPTNPGYYWYGVHAVEMIFTVLGRGCEHVTASVTEDFDVAVGVWKDGRIGVVRGNRKGGHGYGAFIHYEKGPEAIVAYGEGIKPMYASMLEAVIGMFQTGESPLPIEQSVEIMRFMEAANESRESGSRVYL